MFAQQQVRTAIPTPCRCVPGNLDGKVWIRLLAGILLPLLSLAASAADPAQDAGETACLKCHGKADIGNLPAPSRSAMVRGPLDATQKAAAARSPEYLEALYVTGRSARKGVHTELLCTDCHGSVKKLPHAQNLPPVNCRRCHEKIGKLHAESLHGRALREGNPLAPRCTECHGSHEIFSHRDPKAPTYMLNIPLLCGRCHREGAEVQRMFDIPQHNILANYSQSIHGEGLFQKGLTVTAVCTSCHTPHHILPHDDPRSSISAKNVSKTCMKCHGQIERVHTKVIDGKLWEEAPDLIPVCVDCHEPHKIRKVFYTSGMSDSDCLSCHVRKDLEIVRDGQHISLAVDVAECRKSAHARIACSQCHTGGVPTLDRPCETIPKEVDCGVCHAEIVMQYRTSTHGRLAAQGDPDAPKCADCHGTHGILKREEPLSPTFPKNVPTLCGKCHREGEKAAKRYKGTVVDVVRNYTMSIHGKGLLSSGLLVTATCSSCHTAHRVLPRTDPESTICRANIPKTCGNCHSGIIEVFQKSVHSPLVTKTGEKLPECIDCHFAHSIRRADESDFKSTVLKQCGGCHEKITETYFDTYHGKVSRLGSEEVARCQDCHGAHDILPHTNPDSRLSEARIVGTCKKCHPGAHLGFTTYLTHATHHDREKYPLLWAAFWFMTTLLVSTMALAFLHTLFWLPRSIQMKREARLHPHDPRKPHYLRFPAIARKLHFVVIVSFLGLAISGMALKFSYAEWAQVVSSTLGGSRSLGNIHRFCALLTFGYAVVHLWWLWRLKRERKTTWLKFIFDRDSLMFNLGDLRELRDSLLWFTGRGPRPDYGRWTYWEKFDYFAVFWGVAIIGSTGLVLWFPEVFTLFLPGKLINVATIVHSDEALLAAAFIFTIHFFNTHLRVDKFPMDTVIFTGRITIEELKRERPREYREWVEAGRPVDRLRRPMPDWYVRVAKFFGFTALALGLTLIVLIVYALFLAG